jgi:hypothetical protein
MKKVMKNWRYWLMMAIAFIAFFNLIGMPHNDNPNYWELVIYSKFTAVALAYIDIRLYVWFAKHRKIDELLKYINEDK